MRLRLGTLLDFSPPIENGRVLKHNNVPKSAQAQQRTQECSSTTTYPRVLKHNNVPKSAQAQQR
ncbi:hypothetical protein, partial [Floridanema aerugineum]